jgi:7,8-dihydro-6-hydroxymethylpterin-pyrophosphokinase
MDIDILFYDKEVINMPELTIPHPRLHERNFVLMPLCELAAELIHPVLNKTIRQLKAECKDVKWTRIVPE